MHKSKNMKWKIMFSYLFTIIILIILFFWIDKSSLQLLLETKLYAVAISVLLSLICYFSSGVELYFIRKQFGVSVGIRDIFLLPIVGNLWSFIIPVQGNLLFTTLFFKQKYNMRVSESFSISIYLYLVTLCFAGLFGMLFAYFNDMIISWFSLFSLTFLLNPLFIFLLNNILKKIKHSRFKLLRNTQIFISSIIDNTGELWKDLHFSFIILIINICRILLTVTWFWWISYALGLDFSFIAIGLISLIMSVSLIIKVTPDNLGVAQLITGGLMGLIGIQPEKAVLITLFASATSMLLIFTVGVYGNFYYFKTMNFSSLVRSIHN